MKRHHRQPAARANHPFQKRVKNKGFIFSYTFCEDQKFATVKQRVFAFDTVLRRKCFDTILRRKYFDTVLRRKCFDTVLRPLQMLCKAFASPHHLHHPPHRPHH